MADKMKQLSTMEMKLLDVMRPVFERISEPLSKLPNPMTLYLAELVLVLVVFAARPDESRMPLARLAILPLMISTTLVYFLWKVNELHRTSAGLLEVERRKRILQQREDFLREAEKQISVLSSELDNILTDMDKSPKRKHK